MVLDIRSKRNHYKAANNFSATAFYPAYLYKSDKL